MHLGNQDLKLMMKVSIVPWLGQSMVQSPVDRHIYHKCSWQQGFLCAISTWRFLFKVLFPVARRMFPSWSNTDRGYTAQLRIHLEGLGLVGWSADQAHIGRLSMGQPHPSQQQSNISFSLQIYNTFRKCKIFQAKRFRTQSSGIFLFQLNYQHWLLCLPPGQWH